MGRGSNRWVQRSALPPPPRSRPSEKKPLRIALIAAGGRGTGVANLVTKIAESENVQIVAVCDIYQPRLERAEVRFKAKGYRTTAELMKDKSIDAVIIATPDRHHIPNALEAIRAGKDVYVEKPVCHWGQFDKLKAFVKERRGSGHIVQVGTQFIADSMWERAGEELNNYRLKPVGSAATESRGAAEAA